ncbi:uncharacterized protein LOC115273912 isoform X2 [Suricata suricatta]|uniref:uncharacterized protein LOC115273912 isoform X2 n=1 Tax=Suricata suricatta TaxID=37032 RepID=UPI0011555D1C|nr:uncharacterized protein LOC115273912 isoform X2 [Suricata suricatta]
MRRPLSTSSLLPLLAVCLGQAVVAQGARGSEEWQRPAAPGKVFARARLEKHECCDSEQSDVGSTRGQVAGRWQVMAQKHLCLELSRTGLCRPRFDPEPPGQSSCMRLGRNQAALGRAQELGSGETTKPSDEHPANVCVTARSAVLAFGTCGSQEGRAKSPGSPHLPERAEEAALLGGCFLLRLDPDGTLASVCQDPGFLPALPVTGWGRPRGTEIMTWARGEEHVRF